MKFETRHQDINISFEFTPEEIGKFVPFLIRSLFNKKRTIIQTSSLLKNKLISLQDEADWKKFAINKSYLKDDKIALFVQKIPFFIKKGIKDKIINEYEISSYKESNIFFAIMDLLFDKLKERDITKIFERFIDNDQSSPYSFFEDIQKRKPKLLISKIINHLHKEQLKWDAENGTSE